VERAIPFERDEEHAAYDVDHAQRFCRQQLPAGRLVKEFRADSSARPARCSSSGTHGPSCQPLLRSSGTAPPRRGAQRRRLGDGRGLLARAEQRGVLARWRRRGRRLLRLHLPGPGRIPGPPGGPTWGVSTATNSASSCCTRWCAPPRSPTRPCSSPAEHLRGFRRARPVGPACPRGRPRAPREAAMTKPR
jgi:hypothetical protein